MSALATSTHSHLRVRLAGLFVIAAALWYVPWLLGHANWDAPWLSVPFVAANLLVAASTVITALNNWDRSVPPLLPVPEGAEPKVVIIIPTYGETSRMVQATLASVLEQDWPHEQLVVVVSDDAHSAAMQTMVKEVQRRYRDPELVYFRPPPRSDPARRGEAKAGNLNAALAFLRTQQPDVDFVETRDADDEVGDRSFLRQAVGQLLSDDRIAYVQTIKEARVAQRDPFGNQDPLFYRGAMLARHAANAVFPCGSGLIWRRAALDDIDGFPDWNLVEDLESGFEALRRGWRGVYLPIVGAVGQVAPEDIPNVYKQRGTWALDSLRLVLWKEQTGLSLRQRLHFWELGLFYAMGLAVVVFALTPAVALGFEVYPLVATQGSYALRFWPFAAAIEVFLIALNSGHNYETLWRARQMWMGMAPVYAKACLLALWYGPHDKPTYRVTRKDRRFAWYWRETVPQMALVGIPATALIYGLLTTSLLDELDLGSAYWAVFSTVFLAGFIRKGWLGVGWRAKALEALRPLFSRLEWWTGLPGLRGLNRLCSRFRERRARVIDLRDENTVRRGALEPASIQDRS